MTPTSAIGRADAGGRRAGFTLVELLVTLTVIGLAAGAVVLTAPDPRPRPGLEAERLAARLIRAREGALLTNRLVAVEVDATGYRFAAYGATSWSPLVDGPFRPVDWPEGLTFEAAPETRFVFDSVGAAEPASVSLGRGRSMSTITVDAAGEVRLES